VLNIRDITDRRRAEENIRRAKQEWETTSDAVSDLIILTDLTGKILRCNRAVSNTFAIPIRELIGLSLTKVFYDSADAVAGIFTPQLSAQALLGSRREDVHCARLERWFAVARHPVRPSENETLQGFVYLLTDVTERKQMEDLLRGRVIQPHDLPTNLREFRKSLRLSQKAFGQEFGGYSQRQINSYESGEIEIPMSLLLAIKNRGYSLDVLFAPSQADAINNAIGALATNQKTSAIMRQLLSAVLRVLDQEHVQRDEVLAQLGTPQSGASDKETERLRAVLQRLGLPGE
jgi:PAS domain S-box-containing protein